MKQASVRELKAHLSEYLRQVEAGARVTVSLRRRPVARLVPASGETMAEDLVRQPGIRWSGGKPAGLARPERLRPGKLLSDRVVEDRR